MNALYLTSIILTIALQNVIKKPYVIKTKGKGTYFFGVLMSLGATVVFLILCYKPNINSEILPYSLAFALLHSIATASTVIAISCGLLSLTSLMIQYSLLLPTFYGLLYLGDSLNIGLIPGLICLVISLYFINKKDDKSVLSLKWIVATLFAFLGNGLCSIVQKVQQIRFNNVYNNKNYRFSWICYFIFNKRTKWY